MARSLAKLVKTQNCAQRKVGVRRLAWARVRKANEFADRSLVPRERVMECFEALAKTADRFLPHGRVSPDVRRSAAESIAPRFGLHPLPIEARFDREAIWPLAQ